MPSDITTVQWDQLNDATTVTLDGDIEEVTQDNTTVVLSDVAGLPGPEASAEYIIDAVATALEDGTNITITYDDNAGTITITAAGITSEEVVDLIGSTIDTSSDIIATFDDLTDSVTLTFAVDMATQAELATEISNRVADVDAEESARIAADSALQTSINGKQASDQDLTDISGLTPSNDDIMQRKSGAWTNRTPSQVKTDLALTKSDVGLGNVDDTSDSTKNSATATLTNKRITRRVGTVASSATPTINTDSVDVFSITALAEAITSMTTNLSGTPTDFQTLIIRIKDNGTARAIAWGASFASRGVTLPTTTVLSKTLTLGFLWNSTTLTWDCVASAQEA